MFELLLKHSPWAYRAGELAFASGWPLWLLGLLIAAGGAFVTWSLLRRPFPSGAARLAIGTLQTLLLALVLVLLWRPVLNVERVRERQNVVAVLMDASASMAYGEDGRSRLQEAVQAFDAGPLDALRRSFAVRLFSFAETTAELRRLDAMPAPGPQTRIGDALRDALQTASSVPLAAIVVVSDGAENGGTLSEDRLAQLAGFGVPIHTVGAGPEKIENDLELQSVNLAQRAAPGEVLSAEVSIRHDRRAKTRLRVYDGLKLLAAKELELSADAGVTTQTVELPAGEPGVRDLRFTLDPLENERNTINNTRTHLVDVPEKRRDILYVEGEPRWEYKFIRRAAEADRSVRLASLVRATPNRYYRQGITSAQELSGGVPRDAAQLFAYDAVIIGSFEAAALSADQHRLLRDFVDRRGGGLLMLAGRDGLADGGWGRTALAQVLPAHLGGSSVKSFVQRPVKAQLTVYGAESAIGRLDSDPRRNAALWSGLPALTDFQPLGRLKPGAVVLLESAEQKRRQPLLVWQRYGRGTTYLLSTASTWRWKMRLPHDDPRHATFWRQLLHALAAGAPARVSISGERSIYDEERTITLHAELRDERFEPIDDAEVELAILPQEGASSVQKMHPSGDGDGRYTAVIEAEVPGLYRIDMTARAGDRELASTVTHVRRNVGVLEHFGAHQNRALLERVAGATGGRYWRLDELGGLAEAIRYSRAGILERQTLDLWNLPAVFLLLLGLKGLEWLLRLRWRTL